VGSFASKPGAPVNGILIAPVIVDGRTLIPPGSLLSGKVKSVTRVGFGVVHERASLGLEFNHFTLPGGEPVPLHAQIAQVDNARERVTPAGLIQGIRSTGSISYRVSGYVRTALLWDVHAEMAEWAIKSLLVQLPEPEIYYPPGTELTLRTTRKLTVITPLDSMFDPVRLQDEDLADLQTLVASMPLRTLDPETNRPSDLTNVLLVGTREEIAQSFRAAGWTEAEPVSIRSRIGCIRAAAEIRGFKSAPMTPLLLDGNSADMSWQKGFNDVAKRHHIRIWKQPGMWYGQELWMGAATRDVDFAYMRPGRPFTHEIDPKVDEERDKVAYDLAFTSCARPLAWAVRQGMPRFTRNATGDPIATDTRMVVLQMNSCPASPTSAEIGQEFQDTRLLKARGGKWHRFARREIIITRNDFLRTNIYYRSYEASRWVVNYVRYRKRKASETRALLAEYGPGGSSPAVAPHLPGLAVQTLR
jgi:LssY C-terminus